jgi:hypothetical protein
MHPGVNDPQDAGTERTITCEYGDPRLYLVAKERTLRRRRGRSDLEPVAQGPDSLPNFITNMMLSVD